jgi:hypothetical protein
MRQDGIEAVDAEALLTIKRWRQIRKQRMSKPMSNCGDSFSLSYTVRTNADV